MQAPIDVTQPPQTPTPPPPQTHREVSLKPGEQGVKMQVVLPDPKGQKDRALRFLPTVASPDSTVAKENAALLALLHVRWCLCVNGFWFGFGLAHGGRHHTTDL